MARKLIVLFGLCVNVFLTGCINIVGPNDPNFAPVFPDRPPEQTPDMGSIYFPKEGISLYEDIKARKVGDIITVVLTEKTNASKTSNSKYEKQSQETLPEPTIFSTTAKWD
ncbi:MAG: flagellar basal body L-ring protein FlgH, partial [Candidatus Berkiella sp.]